MPVWNQSDQSDQDGLQAALRWSPHHPSLDLRGIRFVTPAIMAGVAAGAQRARAEGRPASVAAPLDAEVAHYAARMRLGDVLSALGTRHDFPAVRSPTADVIDPAGGQVGLLELCVLDSDAQVDALAQLVFSKLEPLDAMLAAALHQSLGEVGVNVNDHSGTTGFVVAQTMPGRGELRLAVADPGVGLRASLARHEPPDDRTAIGLALGGASRFLDPGRGTGLSSSLRLVTGQDGSMLVASGSALRVDHGRWVRHAQLHQPFHGTLVEARIPLSVGRHARGYAPGGVAVADWTHGTVPGDRPPAGGHEREGIR